MKPITGSGLAQSNCYYLIEAITSYKNGYIEDLKDITPLKFISESDIPRINLERIVSFKELANANPVLDYVEKTLLRLMSINCSFYIKSILCEVLIWSEVAKGGDSFQRIDWISKRYNLYIHNIGSAQIYADYHDVLNPFNYIVYSLIKTHGLIGQHIRGEVGLDESLQITDIAKNGYLTKEELLQLLLVLNECVIAGVSEELWSSKKYVITKTIRHLIFEYVPSEEVTESNVLGRLIQLRETSIKNGEDTQELVRILQNEKWITQCLKGMRRKSFWYVEGALSEFASEEFMKILIFAFAQTGDDISNISFEKIMESMYYELKGKKTINLYKKRIIENYLSKFTLEDAFSGRLPENPHMCLVVERPEHISDMVFVSFDFKPVAEKLIDFCTEAANSGVEYEQSTILLYDFFGLRKDEFDRFHNEEDYLADMNGSSDFKKVMLNYVVGDTILDVGPGGGVMLDMAEEMFPDKQVLGIDLSDNVIKSLNKRKKLENKRWTVDKGDALNLKAFYEAGTISTILFSSVLHELYSFVEFGGEKFNKNTIAAALRSAFEILPAGGRIIIRDGIMTEPDNMVLLEFLNESGPRFLRKYARDFQGRDMDFCEMFDGARHQYEMKINDAMEFLYTYTWGEEAYIHEVKEQFGYFTPSEYASFIDDVLGPGAVIIENRHYLQDGYHEALKDKVVLRDAENNEIIPLPDSTCLIVIEKKMSILIPTKRKNTK